MPGSTTLLTAGLMAGYTLLLLLLAGRDRKRLGLTTRRWLVLTLLAALVGAAAHLLPADAHTDSHYETFFVGELTQPTLAIIAANLMFALFAHQMLRYLQYRRAAALLVVGLVWWATQTALTLVTQDSEIGRDGWLGAIYQPVDLPGVVAVGGWVVIGIVLMVAAFQAFYKAHLPEVANRALFCAVLLIPLVLAGVALGASGSDGLAQIGWALQLFGLIGAVYSVLAYRLFDIRRTVRHAVATALLTLVTALVIVGTLLIARGLGDSSDALTISLGVLVAIAYIPLRRLAQAIANRLVGTSAERISRQLRRFSEEIAGVVELDALVDVTMRTLGQALRVRRGGLILVSEPTEGVLKVEPFPHGLGEIPDAKGQLAASSPVGRHLLKSRAPLLQYDLDFGRAYADATPDERRFFQQMRMSAYAPVRVQGRLVGILCCGAKVSDDPFTDHDLELLITVANQAGAALRNARLVGDLRRREAEQAELNRTLSATTEQLEKLDGVKTDFITIASHELRTPLAQIRGYTDIMEAMNEQEMLDQDEISGMTASLRRASDRLEELIGAMLDVSQLDVNAMDLRFAQTGIENVVRMAIEPLTEAIKNRKLMLSARGLRSLPPIQADMQRLVQAFRNVVLNAIKYTPDGGRIDITGRMEGDMIVVAVQDSGIGIDPANHELIFQKFYRAQDPNLHSTGTTKFMGAGPGLGLTIARGVVEGHGGRIWVESEALDPERCPGSTFYIALPLTPPSSAKRVLPFAMTDARATWDHVLPSGDAQDEPLPADSSPTIPRPPGWAIE